MSTDILIRKAVEMVLEKSVSSAERKKDFHAGPHDSFPIGPAGEHLKAAWDLAGHAADPDAVRAKILRFAHEHGLVDHLPTAARNHMKTAKKAQSSQVQELFRLAWNHEAMEGDRSEQRRLAQWASEQGLAHLLPDEAHSMMHEHYLPHNHEGVENDAETGLHSHPVVKAFNPIALQGTIIKSWDSGSDVIFEGWLSTPDKDLEKDVSPPRAFLPGIDGYFERRAPLSIEHNGKSIPIGHLQKAAILENGKVLKSAVHPTDPHDFEHIPSIGSGVWVRGCANEEPGISAIRKGNVGGMSFIANAPLSEPLPGGRYRYLEFNPWIESTIAAYPINPQAVIAVAKAYGLQDSPTKEDHMDLEQILKEAAEKVLREQAAEKDQTAVKSLTLEDLKAAFSAFETRIDEKIETSVQKALPTQRGEGVGRKGETPQEDPREADPANYIVQKAASGELTDPEDRALAWGIMEAALLEGMIN